MLKITVFQSMEISPGGNAEHRDAAAVAHVGKHVAEGRGVAGHFEADIETFRHVQFLLNLFEAGGARVDGAGDSGLGVRVPAR